MNKIPDSTDVIGQLFRKRKRRAHEPTTPLTQCVVEALDMVGLTALLVNGTVPFGGDDCRVSCPKIRVTGGTLPIHAGKGCLQLVGRGLRPAANGDANNLTGCSVEREPNPLLPLFLANERPEFITFKCHGSSYNSATTRE